MNIHIMTIPHNEQRYKTVGDYYWLPNGDLLIYISDMGSWKKEALVALHELTESILTKARDIPELVIKKFDEAYEAKRKDGDVSEPGDAPSAPYKKEHFFATNLERLMAAELHMDWSHYEKTVNSL